MKKILMLTTGGTITSLPSDEGLAPTGAGTILSHLGPAAANYDITTKEILTLDSTTALVDGEPVELREAVRAVDGRTAAPPSLFAQAWNVSPSAAYASHDALFGGEEPVAWLVIP